MIAEIVKTNLLAIAAAYRRGTGDSLTQISKEFYGNSTFFNQIKRGEHSVSVRKLDEMVERFREKWPPDTAWPPVRVISMGHRPQE